MLCLLASTLLAFSSHAGATASDTESVPVILPIGARQSLASSIDASSLRRRLAALRENAANFSLPLEGAIKDYGYFTTSLLLGTPPKPFSVIVDTGSTLTYVACSGCASSGDCGPRHSSGSGFDAAASSTFKRVKCGDAEKCSCGSRQQCGCEALGSSPDSLEASLEGNCTWSREYAEESSASGRLVTDLVTLPVVGAAAPSRVSAATDARRPTPASKKDEKAPPSPLLYRRVPVTFGCTTRETGEIFQQVADGILGMGAAGTSFPSQLGAAGALEGKSSSSSTSSPEPLPPLPTEDATPPFSLCMGGPEGGGALLLGPWLPEKWVKVNGTVPKSRDKNSTSSSSPPLPRGKKPFVQTPLVPSPGHPYYYAVGLESILLGGRPLEGFDASVFREGHGAVLDSGTTFTYLPGVVFNALEKVVRAAAEAAKLPVVPGNQPSSYGDLCWGGLEGGEEAVGKVFPRMQLRFAAEEGGGGAAFGGKAAAAPSSSSPSPSEKPEKRILRRRRRRRVLLSPPSEEEATAAAGRRRALKQNAAADAARVAAANAAAAARVAAATRAGAAGLPTPSPAAVAAQNAAEMARVTAANAAAAGRRRRRRRRRARRLEQEEEKNKDGKSKESSSTPPAPPAPEEEKRGDSEKSPASSSSPSEAKKSKGAEEKPAPSSSSETKKSEPKASSSSSSSPPFPSEPKPRRRPRGLPAAELDLPPLNYLFAHVSRPGAYCLGSGIFSADGKEETENHGPSRGSLLGGITTRDVLVQYDAAQASVGFGVGAGCRALGEGAAAGLEAAQVAASKKSAAAAAASAAGAGAPSPALAPPASASSSKATAKSAETAGASFSSSSAAAPASSSSSSSSSSATVLVLSSVGAAAGAAACFALAAVLARRAWKARRGGAAGFQPFDGSDGGGSGATAVVVDGGESGNGNGGGGGGGGGESRPAPAAPAAATAAPAAAAAAAAAQAPAPSRPPPQPQTLRVTELTPMPPIVPALPPPPTRCEDALACPRARLTMRTRVLHTPRRVSMPRREPPRRNRRDGIEALKPEDPSTLTSTSTPSTPPRPSFPPRDAYDAVRALALSLAVTSVAGGGGGVGSLANWLVEALSLPLADARALSALAVEGAQLAGVSLVASPSAGDFAFDFRDGRAIALGLAGGIAAVAAVGGADFLLSNSLPASGTATSVAASVLLDASNPLSRAALLSASCFLAPATEELVFRGVLLRGLLLGRRGRSGESGFVAVAVAASAAAFSASHFFVLASDGTRGEIVKELLLLFVLGIVLGATAVKSNEGGGEGEEGRSKSEGENQSDGDLKGKREESSSCSDSFNLAASAIAHALYNTVAYLVAGAAAG